MVRTQHPIPTGLVTKKEKIAGWLYLPIHILVVPLLLPLINTWFPNLLTNATANLVYIGGGVIFVLLLLRGFLRRDFDSLLDNGLRIIVVVINAYVIYWIATVVISVVWAGLSELLSLDELLSGAANPNDEALQSYTGREAQVIKALAICLAPIIEEVLFRGVLFGQIRKTNRILAYIVSAALFGVFHIWQYALLYQKPTLLLYSIQYIPHAIGLAWSYEHSDSIWVPIFCHMALNMLAYSIV